MTHYAQEPDFIGSARAWSRSVKAIKLFRTFLVGSCLLLAVSELLPAVMAGEPARAAAEQVRQRELAFAKSMAARDHASFATFVSEEAIFMGKVVLRGRKAVSEGWKRFFEGSEAPFSWEPERVEVTDSGTLAISTGPVRDPAGKRIGTFNSTWRLEPDGEWRVVIDIGCPPCGQ